MEIIIVFIKKAKILFYRGCLMTDKTEQKGTGRGCIERHSI